MLILLCLILTFTLNGKIWPCLFRSCWTIIVLGFSRNCLDTGIIIEWVLENFQRYCKFSRIMSFYLLFVCSLIFGIECWTQLYIFPFFYYFAFFLQFSFDTIQELFRQIRELFRYGNHSGSYGKYSGRWGPELCLFFTFCLFLNFWNLCWTQLFFHFFIILLFLQFSFDTIWKYYYVSYHTYVCRYVRMYVGTYVLNYVTTYPTTPTYVRGYVCT